jgi:flagellar biosynthetic protein FlhB
MAEKTEAPTGRRLQEARKEGQVIRSQELNAAAGLMMSAWLISGPGKKLLADFQSLMIGTITALPTFDVTPAAIRDLVYTDFIRLAGDVGLIMVSMLFTGVVITVSQTGLLWASKRIGFDFNRLNFLKGFQRLFSGQGLVELLRSLLKLSVVAWVAYGFLSTHIAELVGLIQTDFRSSLEWWASMAISLMWRMGSAYLVLALLDYAYQRWHFMRSMRMTKDEVKEEYKQMEGDPMIKARIRGQQRRMARMRMMANVPKADVIITNPTHLAVAIQYDQKTMKAPRVLAKGAHLVAERIVALARSKGIPVIQNIPVARALYRTVEIDSEVPPELYMAIAEILAYVYRMRGATPFEEPAAAQA